MKKAAVLIHTVGSLSPSSVKNQSYCKRAPDCIQNDFTNAQIPDISERGVFILHEKVKELTCWMSVSTILYWSGMCVTMWVILSSDVLTSVGPNTIARFRGSIWNSDKWERWDISHHKVSVHTEHQDLWPMYQILLFCLIASVKDISAHYYTVTCTAHKHYFPFD